LDRTTKKHKKIMFENHPILKLNKKYITKIKLWKMLSDYKKTILRSFLLKFEIDNYLHFVNSIAHMTSSFLS